MPDDRLPAMAYWARVTLTVADTPRAVIIPVGIFEARRVRWAFRHEFAGQPVRIEIVSFDPQHMRANGWTDKFGAISLQNEILKYIYYRLTY